MPFRPERFCASPGCGQRVLRGHCRQHALALEQQRHNLEVRRWYRTQRWFALRDQVRRERPFCDDCEKAGTLTPWTDLDHTLPHRGDPVLFWSRENVSGKCKAHHTAKTARGE